MARFSQTIDERDAQLRRLLANANKVTAVLAERSDQVVGLVANTNALLVQLQTQSAALDDISANISALAQQLSGFIADNRAQLRPALDKLNGVLTIVDNRKDAGAEVDQAAQRLCDVAGRVAPPARSSRPTWRTCCPGQFVQPFIDAAFSDLGLDPNVLLPSERTDPQTGQPGTPRAARAVPRTGQGGEPHLTLPDAITGNPGDPRYPYRAYRCPARVLPLASRRRRRRRVTTRRGPPRRPRPASPAHVTRDVRPTPGTAPMWRVVTRQAAHRLAPSQA